LRMDLLVVTGTMGSGKTSVLSEASDILALHKISHAQIDLDALGAAYLSDDVNADTMMYENLASVAKNYVRLGLTRFLIARAIENRVELDRCCRAVGASETAVCRLVANDVTMRQRVAARERGIRQQEFVERVASLTEILDKAAIEDFTISTENRSVTDVAREMLIRARWISG
jgi:hypothetical protein